MQKRRCPITIRSLLAGCALLGLTPAQVAAEVATDGTLGVPRQLQGPDYQVTADLGRQAGANLFHSFDRFSIDRGESATFSGPSGIRHIINRVTGGQQSTLDGTLRSSIPGADLYLLNPAGVLVGEHARLDIGGSLFLSSANYLQLADGTRFSSSAQPSPVLSVAPPASFGFVSDHPAPIRVNGAGLGLRGGQGFSLVGGDLTLSGDSSITAPGGSISLTGLSGPGQVTLGGRVSPATPRADAARIELNSGVQLDSSGRSGGRLSIRGGEILLRDSTLLSQSTGDAGGQGVYLQGSNSVRLDHSWVHSSTAGSGAAGPVRITSPRVSLGNSSGIVNSSFGSGQGGATRIEAERLTISGGSAVYNEARADGAAGSLSVSARESVRITGNDPDNGQFARLSVRSDAAGDAGRLQITTPVLLLDGAVIDASGLASGDAGGITMELGQLDLNGSMITVLANKAGNAGSVSIDTERQMIQDGPPDRGSFILAGTLGTGSGGSIHIHTAELQLLNGQITASTEGAGAAGDIAIDASQRIILSGQPGAIAAIRSNSQGTGNAGSVRLNTALLQVAHDSYIEATAEDAGDAGQIELQATETLSLESAWVNVFTLGDGDAGHIQVYAGELLINGDGGLRALTAAAGAGGSIDVHAGRLVLTDGGEIGNEAYYFAAPGAGDLQIQVDRELVIDGRGEPIDATPGNDRVSTGIFSFTGNITVSAADIQVSNSGAITTRTFNDLDGGWLNVSADRIRLLSGGQINGSSFGSSTWYGRGGDVRVAAGERIDISGVLGGRRSGIVAGTRSSGDAGSLDISAPLILIDQGGQINTSTGVFGEGSAGRILINAERLIMNSDGGVLSSSVGHGGLGGDIEIHATESVQASGGFASAYGNGDGASGRVRIYAPTIRLQDSLINSANYGSHPAGELLLQADSIELRDSQIQSLTTGIGDAGSIRLRANRLLTAEASTINTEAERASGGNINLSSRTIKLHTTPVSATVAGGAGDGGNVTLDASALVARQDSDITARADQGHGGRILINAEVFLRDPTIDLDASSNVAGNEGVVEVNAPDNDLSGSIKELPGDYLDTSAMLKDKCSARSFVDQSSLVVVGSGALPLAPEDYLIGFPSRPQPLVEGGRLTGLANIGCGESFQQP